MPDKVDWNSILDKIEKEKCILFLGPGINIDSDGNSPIDMFNKDLAKRRSDIIPAYYEDDGFFLLEAPMFREKIFDEWERFYEKTSKERYKALALIPFHVIVSATPDLIMKTVFKELKIPFTFDYFFTKNPHNVEGFSQSKPLLYNLIGSMEEPDSVVLTHDDLFNYLTGVLGEKKLPEKLRIVFRSAQTLLFLGFQFNKWYAQLILRFFDLHKKERIANRIACERCLPQTTIALYEKEFTIEFISNDTSSFIDELYEHCKNKGILRSIPKEERKADEIIAESKKQRLNILKEQLLKAHKMLSNYENERDLEPDIMRRENMELKIEYLKNKIKKIENEIAHQT